MNNRLFVRLAYDNIKKNKDVFLPFSLACATMVAMFFMMETMRCQVEYASFEGAVTMHSLLDIAKTVCGIIAIFTIIYANKFLMKIRNKEFGLYSVLGMEKKHIFGVVFYEILIVELISIAVGIFGGMVFAKLMYMILLKFVNMSVDMEFNISSETFWTTIKLFAGIFVYIMLVNGIKIFRLKPIEIMKSDSHGDKEPKARWIMTILGIVVTGTGYYLALTMNYSELISEESEQELITLFIAIMCIVLGTYIIFMALSITFLKILKNNKRFFYHKRHFITVSDLMYRMKQNAIGLATICILSTGTIIAIASSFVLYTGIEDVINKRYPYDVELIIGENEEYRDYMLGELLSKYDVSLENIKKYHYLLEEVKLVDGCFTDYCPEHMSDTDTVKVKFIQLSEYNEISGNNEMLEDREVIIYSSVSKEGVLSEDNIRIFDREETLEDREVIIYSSVSQEGMLNEDNIRLYECEFSIKKNTIVENLEEYGLDFVIVLQDSIFENISLTRDIPHDFDCDYAGASTRYKMVFDLSGNRLDKKYFVKDLKMYKELIGCSEMTDIYSGRQSLYSTYGSLLYIGIYIGVIFLGVTILIIYYKQLSEGYDDRERFVIMKKVGMSKQEIKKIINDQIRLVFFLPILVAVVHVAVAFSVVKNILVLFNMSNMSLIILCTVATILGYVVVYSMVYFNTTKYAYKI